jgi:hypothetical protein
VACQLRTPGTKLSVPMTYGLMRSEIQYDTKVQFVQTRKSGGEGSMSGTASAPWPLLAVTRLTFVRPDILGGDTRLLLWEDPVVSTSHLSDLLRHDVCSCSVERGVQWE